ncbi:hypothetical protein NOVOSPHI9U_160011 [Novosphingobium sp. 9U]|nr:hypothetical protein NOVOSPHI9U_160011 [Novosphingobium sp. 9U]
MLGPVTNREPVLHHTGEQPPASAPIVLCGSAPRDYTMFILAEDKSDKAKLPHNSQVVERRRKHAPLNSHG